MEARLPEKVEYVPGNWRGGISRRFQTDISGIATKRRRNMGMEKWEGISADLAFMLNQADVFMNSTLQSLKEAVTQLNYKDAEIERLNKIIQHLKSENETLQSEVGDDLGRDVQGVAAEEKR